MSGKTKKITLTSMFIALAYVAVAVGRIPIVLFLKYEPKDIIITLSGLIMGPLTALTVSAATSLLEMFTISDTGIIGLLMNIISTCAFSCTAAVIYKRKRTLAGAVTGIVVGYVAMVATMLLWNYIITPIYMKIPRKDVVSLILTAILPFNLLKGGLNSAFTFLLYKPVIEGLRKAGLIPKEDESGKRKTNIPLIVVSSAVIVTCVLVVLSIKGII
ncbi:MAG: ECF transporter S component [Ruminococcaceae bacterium]|nr:ECF transporter S component [Oscillospiraceae bacterium]